MGLAPRECAEQASQLGLVGWVVVQMVLWKCVLKDHGRGWSDCLPGATRDTRGRCEFG